MSGISLKFGPVTTLGPSSIPAPSATVCPGTQDVRLHGFSLVNNRGNTPVTGLTVALGNGNAISTLYIESDDKSWKSPIIPGPGASSSVTFSGLSLPVSNAITNYSVVASYKQAQSAPPGFTDTSALVTQIVTANTWIGTDRSDGPVTLTNTRPDPGATWSAISVGESSINLSWSIGTPGNSVLVVRYPDQTGTILPVDGQIYTPGDTI